jgi:hypothetical protein
MYKIIIVILHTEMHSRAITGGQYDARNSTDVVDGGASVVQHGLL